MKLSDLKAAKKSGTKITKNKDKNSPFDIQPMQQKHLDAVIAMIDKHDEDDAEAAEISYNREGLDNQYVLLDGRKVVGVTGFRDTVNTQGTAWLSWTYLSEDIQGKNHGTAFVNDIIDKAKQAEFRKLFVSTSDYVDDEDGDIYANARRFYQSIGFKHALTLPDYFDEEESKIIYEMDLGDYEPHETSWSADAGFICTEVFELLECEDTFTFGLDIGDSNQQSSSTELQNFVNQAKQKEAERLYIGVPSDARVFIHLLKELGFVEIGQLVDYYQQNVNEMFFRKVL